MSPAADEAASPGEQAPIFSARLQTLMEDILQGRAPNAGPFCGNCYNPLTDDIAQCGHCGLSAAQVPPVRHIPREVFAMFRAQRFREAIPVRSLAWGGGAVPGLVPDGGVTVLVECGRLGGGVRSQLRGGGQHRQLAGRHDRLPLGAAPAGAALAGVCAGAGQVPLTSASLIGQDDFLIRRGELRATTIVDGYELRTDIDIAASAFNEPVEIPEVE